MTVCEKIDALLVERKLSRRQLAIKAGIAPSSLQSAMQRNTTMSLDMLFPISEVLNVSVLSLIDPETLVGIAKQLGVSLDTVYEIIDKGGENPAWRIVAKVHKALMKVSNESVEMNTGGPPRIELLNAYNRLNAEGQRIALERVRELSLIPMYQYKKALESNEDLPTKTTSLPLSNEQANEQENF